MKSRNHRAWPLLSHRQNCVLSSLGDRDMSFVPRADRFLNTDKVVSGSGWEQARLIALASASLCLAPSAPVHVASESDT